RPPRPRVAPPPPPPGGEPEDRAPRVAGEAALRSDRAHRELVLVVAVAEVGGAADDRADRSVRDAGRARAAMLDWRGEHQRPGRDDLLAARAGQPEGAAERVRELRLVITAAGQARDGPGCLLGHRVGAAR